MALKWPQIERVGDKLMPITDAEVGLLICYNCPRALAPREIIVPEGVVLMHSERISVGAS